MPCRGSVRVPESLPSDDVHPAQPGKVLGGVVQLGIHLRVILPQQRRGASSAGRAWRSCSAARQAGARCPSRGARFRGRSRATPVAGRLPSLPGSARGQRACVFFDASWNSSQRAAVLDAVHHQGVHLCAIVDALACLGEAGGAQALPFHRSRLGCPMWPHRPSGR